MNHFLLAFTALLFVLGSWCCWNAYRVSFQGRTDIVRFGSRALPGAERLKNQFAWLFLLQGVASIAAAGALLALGSMQLTVWICLASTVGLAVRRSILIRGLELFVQTTNCDS